MAWSKTYDWVSMILERLHLRETLFPQYLLKHAVLVHGSVTVLQTFWSWSWIDNDRHWLGGHITQPSSGPLEALGWLAIHLACQVCTTTGWLVSARRFSANSFVQRCKHIIISRSPVSSAMHYVECESSDDFFFIIMIKCTTYTKLISEEMKVT